MHGTLSILLVSNETRFLQSALCLQLEKGEVAFPVFAGLIFAKLVSASKGHYVAKFKERARSVTYIFNNV